MMVCVCVLLLWWRWACGAPPVRQCQLTSETTHCTVSFFSARPLTPKAAKRSTSAALKPIGDFSGSVPWDVGKREEWCDAVDAMDG